MYDTSGEESDTLCKQAIFGVRIHVLTVLYLDGNSLYGL